MKQLLEYVWIDGCGGLRSKIKIIEHDYRSGDFKLSYCPQWNFDGSSTNQSQTDKSDILLIPVRLYANPFIKSTDILETYLVLCECYNSDMTPHPTNKRHQLVETNKEFEKHECLFGFEQEYILFGRNNIPLQWKDINNPGLGDFQQGPYYCSIGGDRAFGRGISNDHLLKCLDAGIGICGTNAEVMASQWEFQIGTLNMLQACDDLIMARYILGRITENHGCYVSYSPKPLSKWNGSGGHTNFSTNKMGEENGLEEIINACNKLEKNHKMHIESYGDNNDLRLTGRHETSDINSFSYGIADRNCSVRIPLSVSIEKKGYLEDRRPAANFDPYVVANLLVRTVCSQ